MTCSCRRFAVRRFPGPPLDFARHPRAVPWMSGARAVRLPSAAFPRVSGDAVVCTQSACGCSATLACCCTRAEGRRKKIGRDLARDLVRCAQVVHRDVNKTRADKLLPLPSTFSLHDAFSSQVFTACYRRASALVFSARPSAPRPARPLPLDGLIADSLLVLSRVGPVARRCHTRMRACPYGSHR
jgi:hypothetical protein